MKIKIWSDIACPFCFIGKRKLEKALEQFEHKNDIELEWHSYELDPELPKEAAADSFYESFAKKFKVSIDEAKESQQMVLNLAKEVNLSYDYDKLVITNTSDALRLVKLAAESNLATEAEEVLFSAYFEQGKNIGDKQTLIELGTKIGLKADDIKEMLNGNKYLDKIKEDTRYGNEILNLQYIPLYKLNDNQVIQGSIATEDYLKAIVEAYADWKNGTFSDSDVITGQSCSIDGVCS